MDFSYNELQRMLQDSAEAFAQDHADYEHKCTLINKEPGYSEEDWNTIAEMGWCSLLVPEEEGGIGAGPVETMIIMEALGKSLATEPFLSTAVLGARCLVRFGSETQRATYLPQLSQGTYKMAFAHSEQSAYENRYSVCVTAQQQGEQFVLNGTKHTVFDAPTAHGFIVTARTSGNDNERDGITVFLVNNTTSGLSQRTFKRLDSGRASHVTLDHVTLSAAAVIGTIGQGADIIDDLYAHGIAALCGEALGCMQYMHDTTLEYLKVRKQFGREIGAFQALQHRQVDMYSALEEARSLTLAANMALADGLPEAEQLLSMAKAQLSRSGKIVGQGAIQLHGGIGMTDELAVGAHFKRITVMERLFGSSQEHLHRLFTLKEAAAA